jgi:hypothetical protein
MFEGVEYDHVCDVEMESTTGLQVLKLGYNNDEVRK